MELSIVDKNYAYAGELGALYSQAQTTFRVWSPLAEKAAVKLYQNAGSRIPYCVCKMQRCTACSIHMSSHRRENPAKR